MAEERFSLALEVRVRGCLAHALPDLEWFGLFSAEAHRTAIRREYVRHLAGEGAFLVAEANRFPVGQVWVDVTAKRPEGVGVISALRVVPCLQGLGVGTRLIAAAERVMKERRLTAAEIGVEQDNPRARRLYERLGA